MKKQNVHYNGGTVSDEFRTELIERIRRVYSSSQSPEEAQQDIHLCPGCQKAHDDPYAEKGPHSGVLCEPKKCVVDRSINKCVDCNEYPCNKAVAGYRCGIEARSVSADDVTWAILPYVDGQYGN